MKKYRIYTDYEESGNFRIKLQSHGPFDTAQRRRRTGTQYSLFLCYSAADPLLYGAAFDDRRRLCRLRQIFLYADQRRIVIANDVTSKYTRRSVSEYRRIAGYIEEFVQAKQGNYIIFFPSYAFLRQVKDQLHLPEQTQIVETMSKICQKSEKGRIFWLSFDAENDYTLGRASVVMGRHFSAKGSI